MRLIYRALIIAAALALTGCGASQVVDLPTPAPTATPIIIVVVVTATPEATATPSVTANRPETQTPAVPTPDRPAVSAPAAQPPAQSTFRLCATADPATERAIEQFIAGRSFRATLSGGSNGCDQLAITPEPGTAGVSGRQSVSLSADGVKVQIVTENGVTHVTTSAA